MMPFALSKDFLLALIICPFVVKIIQKLDKKVKGFREVPKAFAKNTEIALTW
jgi:hypothetical protein